MAKKGRNVARKTMSRSDDLLEAAGFLAAPEAQKKRIEDALAEAMTTDPIPRPKMRPKKVTKPKRRPEEMENGGKVPNKYDLQVVKKKGFLNYLKRYRKK